MHRGIVCWFVICGVVSADFSGLYDVTHWIATPGSGTIDTSAAPTSISMTSSDANSGSSDPSFCIVMPQKGTISFCYSYSTSDAGAFYDLFTDTTLYSISGGVNRVVLVCNEAGLSQSGCHSDAVSIGDTFCFHAESLDGMGGSATTVISNFVLGPDCTPVCTGKVCGADNGCGVPCPLCSGCCSSSCVGVPCGSTNGCGGPCPLGSGCCPTLCVGKICGNDNGCGSPCLAGSGCCTPVCVGVQCEGDNGCGSICKPGSGCCLSGSCTGKICGSSDGCGAGICAVGSGCLTPPVISLLATTTPPPHVAMVPVGLTFLLSDAGGEFSSITIDWSDGTVDFFPGPYAPGYLTVGSHTYTKSGTRCVKVCADDGTGVGSCDTAYLSTLVCSKKRLPGGSALSITISSNPAGGDPYYLGYDGKVFEFHGKSGEVYNLISNVQSTESFFLNVQFGNGYATDLMHFMGVVMRSIGLVINRLKLTFTVSEEGNVIVELNGNEISSFFNETIDAVQVLFEPNVNFSRTALHMSAHEVHHHLFVKTTEMAIRMLGVSYQPPPWKNTPRAPFFHFVDLEANIIDPTFCPDGVWGRTACGGHHDPIVDDTYRIRGDNLLGMEFDRL